YLQLPKHACAFRWRDDSGNGQHRQAVDIRTSVGAWRRHLRDVLVECLAVNPRRVLCRTNHMPLLRYSNFTQHSLNIVKGVAQLRLIVRPKEIVLAQTAVTPNSCNNQPLSWFSGGGPSLYAATNNSNAKLNFKHIDFSTWTSVLISFGSGHLHGPVTTSRTGCFNSRAPRFKCSFR